MARVEELEEQLEEHDLCGISALCTLVFKRVLALVKGFFHDWDICNVFHVDSLYVVRCSLC